jgi:hypothetical protein
VFSLGFVKIKQKILEIKTPQQKMCNSKGGNWKNQQSKVIRNGNISETLVYNMDNLSVIAN